jgi:hypothetical protein
MRHPERERTDEAIRMRHPERERTDEARSAKEQMRRFLLGPHNSIQVIVKRPFAARNPAPGTSTKSGTLDSFLPVKKT